MRSFCLARPPVLGGIVAMMVAGSPAAYGGDGPWVAGNGTQASTSAWSLNALSGSM